MSWDKDRVRQLRQRLQMTQSEMAEFLGCRQQTISEWEQGLYEPANAYGKLLDQVENQMRWSAPLLAKIHPEKNASPLMRQEDARPPQGAAPAPEASQDDFSENSFDKPFDPAID